MENFKLLMTSWWDSLSYFYPSNLKMFVLLTFKAIKENIFFLKNNLILLLLLVFLLIAKAYLPETFLFNKFIIIVVLTFLLVSIFRPSIDYKDAKYMKSHAINFLVFFLLLFSFLYLPLISQYEAKSLYLYQTGLTGFRMRSLLKQPSAWFFYIALAYIWVFTYIYSLFKSKKYRIWGFFLSIIWLLTVIFVLCVLRNYYFETQPISFCNSILEFFMIKILHFNQLASNFMLMSSDLWQLINVGIYFISPLITFIALFIFDAQKKNIEYIKAVGRAFVMFFYNLPFCMIVYFICNALIYLIYFILSAIISNMLASNLIIWYTFILLIFPFYVCFLTNFYIKRMHEQFSLYYRSL